MSKSLKSTLRSTLALVVFAVSAVLLLTLAEAFFPKYVPKLDLSTVAILNAMAPTGAADDQAALDCFEMAIPDNLEAWNQENGAQGKKVVAVYKAVKGDSAGTWFFETSTVGYKNGEIILITAVKGDGTLLKLTPRKIYDSYYSPADIDKLNAFLAATPVLASDLSVTKVKPFIHDAGATYTTSGLADGVALSAKMFETVAKGGAAQ